MSRALPLLLLLAASEVEAAGEAAPLRLRSRRVEPMAFGVTEVGRLRVVADFDDDGLDDGWEEAFGLDALVADAGGDPDGDGLTNLQEFRLSTDPQAADTDGDGAADGVEVNAGSSPLDPADRATIAPPLLTVRVSPTRAELVRNAVFGAAPALELRLTAVYADGSTRDVTRDPQSRFQSFSPAIVAVDGPSVSGLSAGTATVLASYSGKSAQLTVTVQDFQPQPIAAIDTAGFAYDVAVEGNVAYVADGTGGLVMIDVTEPSAPVIAGTQSMADARRVAVAGRRAFVADNTGILAIVDVTDPATPVLLGQTAVGAGALGVAVEGRYAYVAAWTTGLVVVDVNDPVAPRVVATLDLPGTSSAVTVDPVLRRAAVTDQAGRIDLVDIANPLEPALLGSVAISGNAEDVVLAGIYAWSSGDTNTVSAVDISRVPPTLAGQVNTAGLASRGVDLGGALLFVADWGFANHLPIYNVANAAAPVQVGVVDFTVAQGSYTPVRWDADGTGVGVAGQYVYLTVGGAGLQIGRYARFYDAGTAPPRLAITAPAPGATLDAGQPITVTVRASDDVAVATIELHVDGETFARADGGSAPTRTVSFTVPTPPTAEIRTALIGARAFDMAGNVGEASEVDVTVVPPLDTAPSVVSILDPPPGTVVKGGRAFIVRADAFDDQGVAYVEVEVEGRVWGRDREALYSLVAIAPLEGQAGDPFVVRVTAYDYALNATSEELTLTHGGPSAEVAAECLSGVPALALSDEGITGGTAGASSFSCDGGLGGDAPEAVFAYDVVPERLLRSLTFSTAAPETTFDTLLQVRSGTCADPAGALACVDNVGPESRASLTLADPPPGVLWVFVDGAGSAAGTFGLTVSGRLATAALCAPADARFTCETGTMCARPTADAPYECVQAPPCATGVDSGFVNGTCELAFSAPGQTGQLTFNGTAGENRGIDVNGVTAPQGVTVGVRRPDNFQSASATFGPGDGGSLRIPTLTYNGTHTITVTAVGGASGNVRLRQWSDVAAAITPSAVNRISLPNRDQYARLTFSGAAGQRLGLDLSGVTMPSGGTVVVTNPGGTDIVNTSFGGGGGVGVRIPTLTYNGTHFVLVRPAEGTFGDVDLVLWADVAASLSVGVQNNFSLSYRGQQIAGSFNGVAPNDWGTDVANVTLPAGGTVVVNDPYGAEILRYAFPAGAGASARIPPIIYNGPYTVFVQPTGGATGDVRLTLWSDVGGDVTLGAVVPIAITYRNQRVKKTFSGVAGSNWGFDVSSVTGFASGTIVPVDPYGTTLVTEPFTAPGGVGVRMPTLQYNQPYTVRVVPESNATGAFNMVMWSDVTGNLALGAVNAITLPYRNQQVRMTFDGVAGSNWGIEVASVTGFAGGNVLVRDPYGTSMLNTAFGTAGIGAAIPTIQYNQPHLVHVTPEANRTGSLDLTLFGDVTGLLTVDATVAARIDYQNQSLRMSFNGVAGRNWGVDIENLVGITSGVLVVTDPYGTVLVNTTFDTTAGVSARMPTIQYNATHTVRVTPAAGATGSFDLTLWSDVGTELVFGTPLPVSLVHRNQYARLPFTGSAGQRRSVQLSGITLGTGGNVSAIDPYSTVIMTTAFTPAGITAAIPDIVYNGVHYVIIAPSAGEIGDLTVDLVAR